MNRSSRPALPGFGAFPVIGILRGFEPDLALEIAVVAGDAGLRALEVTMNSPEVGRQIRTIREQCGSRLFVGAGTVTSSAELGVALEAGAQFIVSPVTDVGLVAECVRRGVPVFPGAVTPTEILQAWSAGATMVKLFPAAQLGPGYVSAVKGPLDQVPLLPTGGITLENAREFLDAGAAGFGVGSPLFQKARMADRQWDWLRERIAAFRDLWPRTRD